MAYGEDYDVQKELTGNQTLSQALQELKINPLVDYLVVRADNPETYGEIAKYIEQSPYRAIIEFLTYYENQRVINRFLNFSLQVKFLIFIFLVLILIFASLVIFNTTLLSIYSQKEEIEIYRLIGASNYVIRLPFLISTTISAFLGFILAEAIVVLFLMRTNNFWNKLIINLNSQYLFYQNFFTLNFWIFGFIFLISIITSLIALQKYLKI